MTVCQSRGSSRGGEIRLRSLCIRGSTPEVVGVGERCGFGVGVRGIGWYRVVCHVEEFRSELLVVTDGGRWRREHLLVERELGDLFTEVDNIGPVTLRMGFFGSENRSRRLLGGSDTLRFLT